MSIFKAYDIRGLVPEQFDEDIARRTGRAFAEFLGAGRLVLGHDMRTHSPGIAGAVAEGITSAGCDVLDIGLASTPMTYHAIGSLECDGGLVVTASHNPGEYNGMKLCREGARPVSGVTGIAEIGAIVEAGGPDGEAPGGGSVTDAPYLDDYISWLAGFAGGIGDLSAAFDTANGMGGLTLLPLLERLPQITPTLLYTELDGSFPNHEANPLKLENLVDLSAAVVENGCAVGCSFDGDADRCSFVDETGEPVPNDLMTALLARGLLADNPGAPVVYDLRSSWAVKEAIAEAGGEPVRDRVGHSFIKATMRERGAIFGGELSGHYYWKAAHTTDNGMLAMLAVMRLLTTTGRPLSGLVADLRRYHATGEINFRVDSTEAKFAEVRAAFADARQDDLDGVTVEVGDLGDEQWWWANIRASNTEPLLRLNLEASSADFMAERRDALIALLGDPED